MNTIQEEQFFNISKNDEQSVENLLNEYKPLVSKIARQYFLMGGEIDDLIQEGMIGLYKAINSFDKTKNATFKTFATLCVKRQIQTAVKKSLSLKNSLFHELFDDSILDIIDTPSAKENPEEKAISKEKYEFIKTEINQRLSGFEKDVLKKYLSGMSYENIAKSLSVTRKSVDNALSRIRIKLSPLLDDTNY